MNAKIISKQDIAKWLESLAEKYEIIAPVTEEGVTRFQVADNFNAIDLGATPARASLREHFTPGTEELFEYKLSGTTLRSSDTSLRSTSQTAEVKPVEPAAKNRLIFGARACDAAALKYVDAVYSNVEPVDAPYFNRREHTLIVGLFCENPSWSCFCTEVGDFLTKPIEIDAYLTDLGNRYYAEALTPKGEELLSQFQAASDADKQAAESIRQKTLEKLPKPADHAEAGKSYNWDHSVFVKLAEKCLGCGVCSYLCPTCHCFDIQDCPKGSKGSRFRCWDTCQFEKFTLMGAGHNPRPSKKERMRQRVFHKFKYSPERYEMLGCVGCGRCVSACPVNIDIQQVINELESDKP